MYYFLGQAANYRAKDICKHTFACGSAQDSLALRKALAKRYGSTLTHTALYHTGRSALAVALKMTLPKGGKVIINGFTCHAVVQAVQAADCEPVYADIRRHDLHYAEKELTKVLKNHPDIQAVIVQNSLGIPADILAIEKIAKKHNLVIIEDLAHSVGTVYADGREAGTVGDAVALSFGKQKSIDTICGGALVVRDRRLPEISQPQSLPRFSDRLRDRWYPFFGAIMRGARHLKLHKVITGGLLKMHFISRSADAPLDINSRLTHWQAKLALKQLNRIQPGRPPLRHHLFVEGRNQVLKELAAKHYYFDEFWYEVPISPKRYYASTHFPENECPVATKVATEIVNVPTYYLEDNLSVAYRIIDKYENK